MALNSIETVVPSRANVYLAPVGTAAPTDSTTALAAAWLHVGHTVPDSLAFNTEPEFSEINSHQSDQPIRRFQTSESASVSVDLLQWNSDNLKAAYGGGTVTAAGTDFKFVPPKMGVRAEKSCIVEIIDGAKTYRYVFVKTVQIEGVSNEFQKGQEARLPLRLAVLGDDAGEPWYMLTNDPAFDPAP